MPLHCDVIIHKQNVVAYQQMKFKSFEHSQAYSADVTLCKRNKKWVLASFYSIKLFFEWWSFLHVVIGITK